MPILFANSRKDKSALSRNSRSRWPKEISIMCQRKKLAGSVAQPEKSGKPLVMAKSVPYSGVITLLSALAQRCPARTGLLTSFSAFDYAACAVNNSDLCKDCLCCPAAVNAGNFRTGSVVRFGRCERGGHRREALGVGRLSHRLEGSAKRHTTLWNPDRSASIKDSQAIKEVVTVELHKTRESEGFRKSAGFLRDNMQYSQNIP